MRTGRSLAIFGGGGWCTWSGGRTWSLGVYLVWGLYLVLGGVPSPRGVYLVRGVPGPGGCTWSGGCVPGPGREGVPGPGGGGGCVTGLVWGVYLVPGGVPGLGGVPGPGGCLSGTLPWDQTRYTPRGPDQVPHPDQTRYTPPDQTRYTPLWTESQTLVKTLPWPNFVAAGNDRFAPLSPLELTPLWEILDPPPLNGVLSLANLKKGTPGTPPGLNFFIFMQFSAETCKIIG